MPKVLFQNIMIKIFQCLIVYQVPPNQAYTLARYNTESMTINIEKPIIGPQSWRQCKLIGTQCFQTATQYISSWNTGFICKGYDKEPNGFFK